MEQTGPALQELRYRVIESLRMGDLRKNHDHVSQSGMQKRGDKRVFIVCGGNADEEGAVASVRGGFYNPEDFFPGDIEEIEAATFRLIRRLSFLGARE